jgi:hypothetical protein
VHWAGLWKAVERMTGTITAYISIGNSDDKLSQREWAAFIQQVNGLVQRVESIYGGKTHGVWASLPYSEYQNACWCIEIEPEVAKTLKLTLARYAAMFRQDSIAWAEAVTHFIGPMQPVAEREECANV